MSHRLLGKRVPAYFGLKPVGLTEGISWLTELAGFAQADSPRLLFAPNRIPNISQGWWREGGPIHSTTLGYQAIWRPRLYVGNFEPLNGNRYVAYSLGGFLRRSEYVAFLILTCRWGRRCTIKKGELGGCCYLMARSRTIPFLRGLWSFLGTVQMETNLSANPSANGIINFCWGSNERTKVKRWMAASTQR